jgi:hypothetical protein
MKKVLTLLVIALFSLVTAGNVFGGEMAKEGEGSGSSYASGTWKLFQLDENVGAFITWEQKGVMLSDDGKSPFNNMSSNCSGVTLWDKGVSKALGYCIGLAPDGDKVLFEVAEEGNKPGPGLKKGKYRYINGTGKFAGIQGGGEYTYYNLRPAADGTYQSVNKNKGHYKLP